MTESVPARLRRLLDERERLSIEAAIANAAAESARLLRIAAGARQSEGIKQKNEANQRLAEVEQEIAIARATIAVDGPADVSDRALVRWLELVEGQDLKAVREKMLAAVRSSKATQDGDFFVHGIPDKNVRILANVDGRIVTVTPAGPKPAPKPPHER